jgi:PPOX class probable F420-dependent enzyme
MREPTASRPHMPGYGVRGPGEGIGLLPWSWAEERLKASREYWVATVRPDGRPHLMPVWGVWHEGAFWFSSGEQSRKARNLRSDPRCSISTSNAAEPVVIEGIAELVTEPSVVQVITGLEKQKYSTEYTAENSCFKVALTRAFGTAEDDPAGSPTRWTFKPDLTSGPG